MEEFWIGTKDGDPTMINAQMLIDEFKVWDYVQSPEIIQTYYNAQWMGAFIVTRAKEQSQTNHFV